MRKCGSCGEADNEGDERFCMSCGADMDSDGPAGGADPAGEGPAAAAGAGGPEGGGPAPATGEAAKDGADAPRGGAEGEGGARGPAGGRPEPGRLVIGGGTVATVDGSYRLVGRADLRRHTKSDPGLISRSHFTVFMAGPRHVICDGPTPVQDGPSRGGTRLNGERLEGEAELRPGDVVSVSDVEMAFEA